eukprot:TRINITY_DN1801_c0_g1_i1.p1 TRINITY_DN1801_c0_g1~~TRINITY_DN1801_c0_g1_i1.p1  ORF type:complete len:248 (-),score=70.82 TRINITY_DN1801_c0_g1_i1:141-884(-)
MDKFVGGIFRAKHKLMNKLGAAEITIDPAFDAVKDRFKDLDHAVSSIAKDIVTFHDALRDMTNNIDALAQRVVEVYAEESDAAIAQKYRQFIDEHKAIKQFVEEAILRQQESVLKFMKEYHLTFKELKDRIAARKDLIVDYDVLREKYDSQQAAGETSKANATKDKMDRAQAEYKRYQDQLMADLNQFCEQHPAKVDAALTDIIRTCADYYSICQEKYAVLGEILEVPITTPKIVEPVSMKNVPAPK